VEAKRKPIRTEREVNDVDPQKGRVLLSSESKISPNKQQGEGRANRPVSGAGFLTNLSVLAASFLIL
jgi:hypothetical protein